MLGDDVFTFLVFWFLIEAIHMITPLCIAITVLRFIPVNQLPVPRLLRDIALVETCFYFLFYLPRRHARDRSAPAFTERTRAERRELFDRCCRTVPDFEQWFSIWFKGADARLLYREDVKKFLAWGFLNKSSVCEEDDEELEEYLGEMEERIGRKFLAGSGGLEPCRVSTDPLKLQHRSLLYYIVIVSIIDTACHILMLRMSFKHFRLPIRSTYSVFPYRPLTLLSSSHVSPSPKLSYWYRPHTSQNKKPVLFLHGIGVGLHLYAAFLHSLTTKLDASTTDTDGQIGILAIEIMPISFRVAEVLPSRQDLVRQIRQILAFHSWTDFVTVAHSFGSIFATHLLRDLQSTNPESEYPLVLVDAVTLSCHFAEIPYNFIYRRPRTASQLLCSFAATDIGVAHCITRMFDWTQNVLWLDELEERSATVVLAGRDAIIDTWKLRRYLARFGIGAEENGNGHRGRSVYNLRSGEVEKDLGGGDGGGVKKVKVVFYEAYNHGEVFFRKKGREELANIVFKHC